MNTTNLKIIILLKCKYIQTAVKTKYNYCSNNYFIESFTV